MQTSAWIRMGSMLTCLLAASLSANAEPVNLAASGSAIADSIDGVGKYAGGVIDGGGESVTLREYRIDAVNFSGEFSFSALLAIKTAPVSLTYGYGFLRNQFAIRHDEITGLCSVEGPIRNLAKR